MEIINLDKPFRIIDKVLLPKQTYTESEMFPSVSFSFYCKHCNENIEISIIPFTTKAHHLDELYENNLIDKESLLKNGVATEAKNWQTHLGNLILFNVPANYLGIKCPKCGSHYIFVFGYGEVQPGRMLFQISGIWSISNDFKKTQRTIAKIKEY